ncbi:MAG: hypothetical protein OHK0039_45530 [Bacteroidia bacterium]
MLVKGAKDDRYLVPEGKTRLQPVEKIGHRIELRPVGLVAGTTRQDRPHGRGRIPGVAARERVVEVPTDGVDPTAPVGLDDPLPHVPKVHRVDVVGLLPQFADVPAIDGRIRAAGFLHVGAARLGAPADAIGQGILVSKEQVAPLRKLVQVLVQGAGVPGGLGIGRLWQSRLTCERQRPQHEEQE